MAKYTMNLELPDDIREFFEALNGQARILTIEDGGASVKVEFDYTGDEYGLAFRAMEVAREAGRHVGERLTFERPVAVPPPYPEVKADPEVD